MAKDMKNIKVMAFNELKSSAENISNSGSGSSSNISGGSGFRDKARPKRSFSRLDHGWQDVGDQPVGQARARLADERDGSEGAGTGHQLAVHRIEGTGRHPAQ
jgi:hypothetical protein